jgi:hypothetical protein
MIVTHVACSGADLILLVVTGGLLTSQPNYLLVQTGGLLGLQPGTYLFREMAYPGHNLVLTCTDRWLAQVTTWYLLVPRGGLPRSQPKYLLVPTGGLPRSQYNTHLYRQVLAQVSA